MLDSAETKTASKISLSKGTFNATHDEFLNRFPVRNIEEIRDFDEVQFINCWDDTFNLFGQLYIELFFLHFLGYLCSLLMLLFWHPSYVLRLKTHGFIWVVVSVTRRLQLRVKCLLMLMMMSRLMGLLQKLIKRGAKPVKQAHSLSSLGILFVMYLNI